MARSFYTMLLGMKQHPETWAERNAARAAAGLPLLEIPKGHGERDHQLLYPDDIFWVEDALIERVAADGGWRDPIEWEDQVRTPEGRIDTIADRPHRPTKYAILCARRTPEARDESFVMRAEPSKVIGINITEAEMKALEEAEEAESSVVRPELPVAANAPASVRLRGAQVKR